MKTYLSLLLISLLSVLSFGREAPTKQLELRLASAEQKPGRVEIRAAQNGIPYYVSSEAGSGKVTVSAAIHTISPLGDDQLEFILDREGKAKIEQFWRKHAKETIGILVNGKLLSVVVGPSEPTDAVFISNFGVTGGFSNVKKFLIGEGISVEPGTKR